MSDHETVSVDSESTRHERERYGLDHDMRHDSSSRDHVAGVAKMKRVDGFAWIAVAFLIGVMTLALGYLWVDHNALEIRSDEDGVLVDKIKEQLELSDTSLSKVTCQSDGHVEKAALSFQFTLNDGRVIRVTCVEN